MPPLIINPSYAPDIHNGFHSRYLFSSQGSRWVGGRYKKQLHACMAHSRNLYLHCVITFSPLFLSLFFPPTSFISPFNHFPPSHFPFLPSSFPFFLFPFLSLLSSILIPPLFSFFLFFLLYNL